MTFLLGRKNGSKGKTKNETNRKGKFGMDWKGIKNRCWVPVAA
jgi:hypothetical protein